MFKIFSCIFVMPALVLASSRIGPPSIFKERFPASWNDRVGMKWEQQTAEQGSS